MAAATAQSSQKISHLVFDIDDTMYPVTNGFTKHRNYDIAASYMVNKLGFENIEKAKEFRDEYFAQHHSMAKVFTVTAEQGLLPMNDDGTSRTFDVNDFAEYYATECKFQDYLSQDLKFIEILTELSKNNDLTLVIFTNGPRKYALKVLEVLGCLEFFKLENIFAVDDLLPTCKPSIDSFEKVLQNVGCDQYSQAVMFEDSMKNVRVAKSIGMKTVLLLPNEEMFDVGDAPNANDPAVDVVLKSCGELKDKIPSLWENTWRL